MLLSPQETTRATFNARFDATMQQNETFSSAVQLSCSIGVILSTNQIQFLVEQCRGFFGFGSNGPGWILCGIDDGRIYKLTLPLTPHHNLCSCAGTAKKFFGIEDFWLRVPVGSYSVKRTVRNRRPCSRDFARCRWYATRAETT